MRNGGELPRSRAPASRALVLFLVISVVLVAAALLVAVRGAAERSGRTRDAARASGGSAPRGEAGAPDAGVGLPPAPAGWRRVADDSRLRTFDDAAIASGRFLIASEGRGAIGDERRLQLVPLGISLSRAFAASATLFAQGSTSAGAPVLVALPDGGEPVVVPVPCALALLAGDGQVIAGACDDATSLVVSRDGARTFGRVSLAPPRPASAAGIASLGVAIEAVAVGSDGSVHAAVGQRWIEERPEGPLAWAWSQVASRSAGKPFRFANAPGLVRAFELRAEPDGLILAGLALEPGEDEPRARLYRGRAGESLATHGAPGPRCGRVPVRGLSDGAPGGPSLGAVVLGALEVAFVCDGTLALTVDGGASWQVEHGLGELRALRGGDRILLARTSTGTYVKAL